MPGSHRLGVTRRFRRSGDLAKPTEFVPKDSVKWSLTDAVPLEIPLGSLVLLHNALVHYSEENKSPGKFVCNSLPTLYFLKCILLYLIINSKLQDMRIPYM